MSEFRTLINVPAQPVKLDYSSRIFLSGSCFSENIGGKLSDFCYHFFSNPFGILYNPVSIEKSLVAVAEKRHYSEKDVFSFNGKWHSFDHHGVFSHRDQKSCLENINGQIESAHDFLSASKVLIITLGTAWVYEIRETKAIAGNCHKLPAGSFKKRLLELEEIIESCHKVISRIRKINPQLQVCFTVSPVRHLRDGVRENTISKSLLHLAVDKIMSQLDKVSYFPSYEIVMDDLRDYRFFGKDMVHPSELAVDYIWEKFSSAFFTKQTVEQMILVEKLNAAKKHRPFDVSSKAHQGFLKKQLNLIEKIEKEVAGINLTKERVYFLSQLNS